jgi:2-oxoglutarate dehydrogenase E1 component
MRRDLRRPLIVFTPKSLLRARTARSPVDALTSGSFLEVLDDPSLAADADAVTRVVLASGKVAYDAIARRDAAGTPVAVLRVEQLYPWPGDHLADAVARFPQARELVWLQEEPENMGAWNFVKGRLYDAFGDDYKIRRVSRYESGSPAAGSHAVHVQEQEEIVETAVVTGA